MAYSNSQNSPELIDTGLNMLAAAFTRRLSDETRKLWHDLFDGEREFVIAKAFNEICNNDDKMPTPKRMREAIALYKPSRMNSATYTPGFDTNGVPCVFWSDEPMVPAYSAEHSSIAREIWGKVLEWSGQVGPQETPEQAVERRIKELQAQKVILHRKGAA